jgi:hypothetical protein
VYYHPGLVISRSGVFSKSKKGDKTMYVKPEIAVLGEASSVILGQKTHHIVDSTSGLPLMNPADSELDD